MSNILDYYTNTRLATATYVKMEGEPTLNWHWGQWHWGQSHIVLVDFGSLPPGASPRWPASRATSFPMCRCIKSEGRYPHPQLSADELYGVGRGDDGDILVLWGKVEQMPVTRDDRLGVGCQSTGENLVVVGVVGHHAWHGGRLDHNSHIQIATEEIVQGREINKKAVVEFLRSVGAPRVAHGIVVRAPRRRCQSRESGLRVG